MRPPAPRAPHNAARRVVLRAPSRGFTLIELLVTMTVAAVLLAIAVPSFRQFMVSQRVKAASYDLVSSLQFARSEAVKRNRAVSVAPDAAAAWGQGWSVQENPTPPATDPLVLQRQQGFEGITVSPKDPANLASSTSLAAVSFGPSGRPTGAAWFEIAAAGAVRCVWIDSTGIPTSKSRACNA
jgi:type IV fimbrial biogenesis protein FimT